jgi:hypothetical protein
MNKYVVFYIISINYLLCSEVGDLVRALRYRTQPPNFKRSPIFLDSEVNTDKRGLTRIFCLNQDVQDLRMYRM